VDQLARSTPLISACGLTARTNQFTSEWIALGQVRHAMARQDRSDGTWRHAQLGADPVWPTPLLPTQLQHLSFDLACGASR
jgi:hypothetical protein